MMSAVALIHVPPGGDGCQCIPGILYHGDHPSLLLLLLLLHTEMLLVRRSELNW
jgi:hypothetical protein